MTVREELSTMFDYDRWANQRWLEPAKALGQEEILLHVLQAQIIWLCRIEGTPTWDATLQDYTLHLDRSVGRWKRFLLGADLGQVISYVNSQGERYDNAVSEIVRHVINHGTYHRGHLRGIASERGIEFPETDYILFLRNPLANTTATVKAAVTM